MFRSAFTIQSDTRYLALLRQWVAAMGRLAGRRAVPRQALLACTLALIEAVDNAIFHACPPRFARLPRKRSASGQARQGGRAHRRRRPLPIRVAMSVRDEAVILEVADRGRGVGRHCLAQPELLVSHGRGLFLIHRLMSKVESRTRHGRHVLRMTRTL